MKIPLIVGISAVVLFLGMLAVLEIGRFVGRRFKAESDGGRIGVGPIEGAIYALLGLLVAFTFSGAASRLDVRRQLIVEEANDISTAYLRLDLLPSDAQVELRSLFKEYLSARLETYRKIPDFEAARERFAYSNRMQGLIWSKAVAGCGRQTQPACTMLLLSALNAMFDIATSRTMAVKIHPPKIVFLMLFGLGLTCALLAGFAMAGAKKRNWFYSIGFALVTAFTFYVILDIEYPRVGLIQVTDMDQALEQVLRGME